MESCERKEVSVLWLSPTQKMRCISIENGTLISSGKHPAHYRLRPPPPPAERWYAFRIAPRNKRVCVESRHHVPVVSFFHTVSHYIAMAALPRQRLQGAQELSHYQESSLNRIENRRCGYISALILMYKMSTRVL